MITSEITTDYSKLFEDAYNKLKEYGLLTYYPDLSEIATMEEYFYVLPRLTAALAERADDVGKFMRIPLDEPHFIIDANARTITVPDDFNKHGVGVIGDQVAETLFFEVDRFFDTTDLNETVIYIQWVNPAGVEGLSYGIWKTATNEKLIFGWALDENIMMPTAKGDGGKIEFAIRFFNRGVDNQNNETDELVYSLSTLSQTINIKKSLNFDVTELEEPDDLTEMLIKRLKQSEVTGAFDPAVPPIIKVEPTENESNLNADGTYLFKAQGYSVDSGTISYVLYKDGEALESYPLYNDGMDVTDDQNALADTDTYYTVAGTDPSGKTAYEVYEGTDIPTGIQLYERYGMYEIDTAGVYSVAVINSKKTTNKTRMTKAVTIPGPSMPVISSDFVSHYQLDADNNAPVLEVKATATDGTLTYQWQKQVDGKYENIDGATGTTYAGAEAENWYNVVVYNTRNNATVSKDADDIRVTAHVEKPAIKENPSGYDVSVGGTIKVAWTRNDRTEIIKVVLCKAKANPAGMTPEVFAATDTNYDVIDTQTDINGNSISFTVNDTGRYFIKMTNTRNTFESGFAYSADFWNVI